MPETCLHCDSKSMYWITRTELDYASDSPSRVEDQVWECSECHTLFRVHWEMKSFTELVEKEQQNMNDIEEFEYKIKQPAGYELVYKIEKQRRRGTKNKL